MIQKSFQKIFLIGVLASLVTGTQVVLAAVDGPTWYGRINVTLDNINREGAINIPSGQAPAASEQWELNSRASRLGIKGKFDTADSSLEAFYLIEYEINVDDGNRGDTALSQRNVYGGLRGNFGEFRYGKIDTLLKTSEGKVDQFNDVVDLDEVIGGQNRIANLVIYSSPKIANAFTLSAEFSPGEGEDVDADGEPDTDPIDIWGSSLGYEAGNFYAALAYETNQLARRSLDDITRADITRLVGTWKINRYELGALIQSSQDVEAQSSAGDDAWLISGAASFGKVKLKGQYGEAEGKTSGRRGELSVVGVDYSILDKTFLYAYVGFLKERESGLQDDVFGFGVSHSF